MAAWAGTVAATVLTAVPAERVSPAEPWPWAVTSLLAALPVLAVLGARRPPPVLVAAWLSALAAGAVPLLVAPDRGGWAALLPVAGLTAAALTGGWLATDGTEARRRLAEEVARGSLAELRQVLGVLRDPAPASR